MRTTFPNKNEHLPDEHEKDFTAYASPADTWLSGTGKEEF